MGTALTGEGSSCEFPPQKYSLMNEKISSGKSKHHLRTSMTAVPASTPLVFVGRLQCLCVAGLGSETLVTQKLFLQRLVSFILYALAETPKRPRGEHIRSRHVILRKPHRHRVAYFFNFIPPRFYTFLL